MIKRGKWPIYDVEGHEDDFNRRFRLKSRLRTETGVQEYENSLLDIFNPHKYVD